MGNYTFEHLNSINLKHYSQTCSNEHLCKMTILSLSKQIPVQSLLSNATSNHFFDSQMKKNLSKTITTKLYPAKERKKKQGKMLKK